MENTSLSPGDWYMEEFTDDTSGHEPFVIRTDQVPTPENGHLLTLCTVHQWEGQTREEAKANATLFAEAKAMLEYLEDHLEDVEQLADDPSLSLQWDWHLTRANLKQLIAQAKA